MLAFTHFCVKRGGSSGRRNIFKEELRKILKKMGAKKVNISIPEEYQTFLDENPSLSPSKIFQGAVENIQHSIKNNPQLIEALKRIENLERAKQIVQRELQRATDFIEKEGKLADFARGGD